MVLNYEAAFDVGEKKTIEPSTGGLSPEKTAQLKTIMKRDPLDPAPLLEKFSRFELPIAEMEQEVAAHAVTDDASSAKCAEMSAQARKITNEIEKAYRAEWEPYKQVGDALRGCKNSIQDRLKAMVAALESKNLPYLAEQRRLKADAERKAREEQARLQREADEKARKERESAAEEARKKAEAEGADKKAAEAAAAQAAAMVQQAPVVVAAAPNVATSHRTDSGSQGIKAEPAWTIDDFSALPPEAFADLEPNSHSRDNFGKLKATSGFPHVWIRRQVAAGAKNIAGVRFYEIEKISTRAK